MVGVDEAATSTGLQNHSRVRSAHNATREAAGDYLVMVEMAVEVLLQQDTYRGVQRYTADGRIGIKRSVD